MSRKKRKFIKEFYEEIVDDEEKLFSTSQDEDVPVIKNSKIRKINQDDRKYNPKWESDPQFSEWCCENREPHKKTSQPSAKHATSLYLDT